MCKFILGALRDLLSICRYISYMKMIKSTSGRPIITVTGPYDKHNLLRQQQVRQTYPNINSDITIHNSLNEDNNNVHTSVRKTTQIPEAG